MRAFLLLLLSLTACEKDLDHEDPIPPTDPKVDKNPKAKDPVKKADPDKSKKKEQYLSNIPKDQASLLKKLNNSKSAKEALQQLVALGDKAVPNLETTIMQSDDPVTSGWAIKALSQIETAKSGKAIANILASPKTSPLLKNWAAAARLAQAKDLDAVLKLSPLVSQYPALQRPAKMKVEAYKDSLSNVDEALTLISQNSTFQSILGPVIIAKGPKQLTKAMLSHKNTQARRLAAGYLAGMARTDANVLKEILAAFDYTEGAKKVPWAGGALYIPSAQWSKKSAKKLVGHLISWILYCELNKQKPEQQKIHNNLRSVGLIRAAGFNTWRLPRDIDGILVAWGQLAGAASLKELLKEHKLHKDSHYKKLIERVSSGR